MSYEQLVEAHHRLTFSNNVLMVAQQVTNPLRNAVMMEPATGEAQDAADLFGKKEYQEADDHSRTNPDNPTKRTRRWLVRGREIEDGEYVTKADMFDRAMDPTSNLVRNSVMAVERGVYDRILGVKKQGNAFVVSGGGILGVATEGKRPDDATPLAAGNYIAATVGNGGGGTAVGLNAVKLRAATEAMELEDFGLETDMEIYGLITPKQKTDLINLALETKTSLNPFDIENIREGKPGRLLGINWLFTNRLPKDSTGNRMCPIWSKSNIAAGVWQDVEGRMWNDTSAKNLPYIYTSALVEAVRLEDGGVRVIRCAEA